MDLFHFLFFPFVVLCLVHEKGLEIFPSVLLIFRANEVALILIQPSEFRRFGAVG